METMIKCALYLLIGIIGGQTIGYGLIEALLWPVFVPIALWNRIKNNQEDK